MNAGRIHMKTHVAATSLLYFSMLALPAMGIAAEPLPASEMEEVSVPPPVKRACQSNTDNANAECTTPDQLKELTDYSIRETTTFEPGKPASAPPPPHVLPEQPVSPQQMQLIEDFTNRPWGR